MSIRIAVTYKHMQDMVFMTCLLSLHDMRGQWEWALGVSGVAMEADVVEVIEYSTHLANTGLQHRCCLCKQTEIR